MSSVSQSNELFLVYFSFCAAARSIYFSLGIADFGRVAILSATRCKNRVRSGNMHYGTSINTGSNAWLADPLQGDAAFVYDMYCKEILFYYILYCCSKILCRLLINFVGVFTDSIRLILCYHLY